MDKKERKRKTKKKFQQFRNKSNSLTNRQLDTRRKREIEYSKTNILKNSCQKNLKDQ